MTLAAIDIFKSYNLIIEASVIIILSFFFSGISKKTNIPSVLMLIILGMILKVAIDEFDLGSYDFFPVLEVLGIVGLIMIVLEAALELELKREKFTSILNALGIALVCLVISTWAAALIIYHFIPSMTMQQAWLYATPLSILSSAIIIPSVGGLSEKKKEFHIYESTFSDILGIMFFYFLAGQVGEDAAHGSGAGGFAINLVLTIALSLVSSYAIILIFQNIKTQVKLFLLISVLLLLYAIGKQMHLSSLIIILIFGLMVANMKLFFKGPLQKLLKYEKAHDIYHGLHVVTGETAFVVRTFFFVIFGLTISIASLKNMDVVVISLLILVSIYLIRWLLLKIFVGKDIIPELFIAPRGLITVLLFYAIPKEMIAEDFEPGILLFIIIATSLVMTFGMIYDKSRSTKTIRSVSSEEVGYTKWSAPKLKTPSDQ